MIEKKIIGRWGENVACQHLENEGYKIIDRNFNCRQGEIDIIAYDKLNREIVFVEVKTRTSFNYGVPSEAVNQIKQRHILKSAKYYLYCNKIEDCNVRIDVIEIVIDKENKKYKINHLKAVL